MTSAWDAFNPNAAPRRRIRGGEIPPPAVRHPCGWLNGSATKLGAVAAVVQAKLV